MDSLSFEKCNESIGDIAYKKTFLIDSFYCRINANGHTFPLTIYINYSEDEDHRRDLEFINFACRFGGIWGIEMRRLDVFVENIILNSFGTFDQELRQSLSNTIYNQITEHCRDQKIMGDWL